MPETAEVTRPIPPGLEAILQYPRPPAKEGHVMEPKPVPVVYAGEEETDLTVLALKYKNKFKFEKLKEATAEETLLQELENLLEEQVKVVRGAFLTIDIDKRASVTEAETAMVFRTLGVEFERETLKTFLTKLQCRNHYRKIDFKSLLQQIEDGTARLKVGGHYKQPSGPLELSMRQKARGTLASADSRRNREEGEVIQPSTEGALAKAVRRAWRDLCCDFSRNDKGRRGVVKERDFERILVSHVSPVQMTQLRWITATFRKGGSELIDYKAVMAYFSPIEGN